MPYPLWYRAEAEAEIANAFLWYEERHKGLGIRFIFELEKLDARISENLFLYQVVEPPGIRRGLFRRFPYSLFYRVHDIEIEVLACFHQHQMPRGRDELLSRI